jgi:hypothetical protein
MPALLDLHDAVLEQQALGAALEALCAVVRQCSGVHMALHVGEVRPGGEARWEVTQGMRSAHG